MSEPKKMYGVFSISEKDGREPFFNRVGYAFVKPDNTIEVFVDTFPLNGRLRLKERAEKRADAMAPAFVGGA